MPRIAECDHNLFSPVSDEWYLRSLSMRRTEQQASYAWFLAECVALAEELYFQLHAPGRGRSENKTVAEYLESSCVKIPISHHWKASMGSLDEWRLKEALQTVGFVAENIDIFTVKRKVRFRNRYFFEVTFKVSR